jgi:hypothetical protein
MTDRVRRDREEEVRKEAEWHGLDIANSIKVSRDFTEDECYELNHPDGEDAPSLVDMRTTLLATRYKWSKGERHLAHVVMIDAFYDRLMGKR